MLAPRCVAAGSLEDGDGADHEPRYPSRHGAYAAAAAALTAALAAGAWEHDLQALRRSVPPAERVPRVAPEVNSEAACASGPHRVLVRCVRPVSDSGSTLRSGRGLRLM